MSQRALLAIHVLSTAIILVCVWVWWARGQPFAAAATLLFPIYLWSKIAWRVLRRRGVLP